MRKFSVIIGNKNAIREQAQRKPNFATQYHPGIHSAGMLMREKSVCTEVEISYASITFLGLPSCQTVASELLLA